MDELRGTTEIRFDQQILPENFVPFVQQAVRRMRANQGSQGEPSVKRRRVEINVEVERNENLPQVPRSDEIPHDEVPMAQRPATHASGSRFQPPPPPPPAFGQSSGSQQVSQSVMQMAYTQSLQESNRSFATALEKSLTHVDRLTEANLELVKTVHESNRAHAQDMTTTLNLLVSRLPPLPPVPP